MAFVNFSHPVARGDIIQLPNPAGMAIPYIVSAVRHYPVDFAELRAQHGPHRTSLPLSLLSLYPRTTPTPKELAD